MKQLNLRPTAKIALKKNVLKIYNVNGQDVVYLPKDSEFEIELFNPCMNKVLAKIYLNNKELSGGGLVLRPGERVFLERYLDENKKFLFDVYEVEAFNRDVETAISNNGLVTVKFFDELEYPPYRDLSVKTHIVAPINQIYYGTTNPYIIDSGLGVNYTTGTSNLNATYTCSTADVSKVKKSKSKETNGLENNVVTSYVCQDTIETGIIDKGSKSNQKFTYSDYNFKNWYSSCVTIKLLPDSQRMVTVDDFKHKKYCSECGSKVKQTDKFCSNCGTKL